MTDKYFLNKGSFVVNYEVDPKNKLFSLACNQEDDKILSINPAGYVVLCSLFIYPGLNKNDILGKLTEMKAKMADSDLSAFLGQMEKEKIIYATQ